MKKWLLLLICSLFGVSLSGCSLQNVVESVSPSREETPQDIHPDSTRVYMDEIQGSCLPASNLLHVFSSISVWEK